jgi:Ca-activated chloride channel family protein
VQFDSRSQVVAGGEAGRDRAALLDGVGRLARFNGGTRMALGLRNAERELAQRSETARKVLLLTDGRTVEEDECRRAAAALAELQAPIVALGVGEEYNEDLLMELCNITQGKQYDLRQMATLPAIFEAELGAATRQVVSDVQATLKTVRDVRLVSATRAYPNLADVDVARQPLLLGNLEAGDHTVFMLELDVPERPPLRARLAQLSLSYSVPAQHYRGAVPPLDLVVEFTADEALAASVDGEVLGYVQQRNVDHLIHQATQQVRRDPEQAAQTLQLARSMTQRLGNQGMTVALVQAEEELRTRGTIAAGTLKTIKVGARTHTMKVGNADAFDQHLPSPEAIRQLSGA